MEVTNVIFNMRGSAHDPAHVYGYFTVDADGNTIGFFRDWRVRILHWLVRKVLL